MPSPPQRDLLPASEAVRSITLATARNSLRYGVFGELETTGETIQRIVEAVPASIAHALSAHAFIFVPLAIGETAHARDTEIARVHTLDLEDRATCHRTVPIDGAAYTFISTRLMQDRFALAFELFINVGHQFVDALLDTTDKAGKPAKKPGTSSNGTPPDSAPDSAPDRIPDRFTTLLWQQALADVRGETSQDAYESRKRAIELSADRTPDRSPDRFPESSASSAPPALAPLRPAAEEQRARFYEAALADTLAIYMLSLAIDFDYADLREREYPLLAGPALADRLRLIADLYPPPPHYEFSLRYRRRH